jgi:FkbM family methyltransferase
VSPSSSAPSRPPWGTHAPGGLLGRLLTWSRGLPATPLGARGARILRTLARVGRPGRAVDVELWGLRLRLHSRGNVSEARILFMAQLWEPRERELLRDRARSGFVFLDVGANAGGYSLWVLGLLGAECRIVAVEPDPEMHGRLQFNADINGAGNVRVLQVAVSDQEGEGVLHLDAGNRGQNRLLPDGADPAGPGGEGGVGGSPGMGGAGGSGGSGGSVGGASASRLTVPLRSLHRIVADEGLPRIDALKIDIEGMEHRVLRHFFAHAPEPLWPRLLITEHHGTPDHVELQELLAGLGYGTILQTGLNRVLERAPLPHPHPGTRLGHAP